MRRFGSNMENYFDPKIGRIIELESKITRALSSGHRASDNDQFQNDRIELKKLREELNIKRKAPQPKS